MDVKRVFDINDLYDRGNLDDVRAYLMDGDPIKEAVNALRSHSVKSQAAGSLLSMLTLKMDFTDRKNDDIKFHLSNLLDSAKQDSSLRHHETCMLLIHHYATLASYCQALGINDSYLLTLCHEILELATEIDETAPANATNLLRSLNR